MKIRQRIALIFTTLTSIVLLFSFAIIYYLSAKYAESDFYDRLQEKATLTAWKYFEEDELSKPAYQLVVEQYTQNLPEAQEIVLNMADSLHVRDSLKKILPLRLSLKLQSRSMIKFKTGTRQGVGLFYPDNQGNFIVMITAFDKYGVQKQHNLLKVLLGILLASIVVVFWVGQFYAKRILLPIIIIMRNMRKINATNLSLRLQEKKGNDELTELTRMFNQMLERLEMSFAMQRNFIHHASHELKNPITAILGETEVTLGKKRTAEEYAASLQVVMTETERLDQLTRNLLALAQTDFDLSSQPLEIIRIDEMMQEINDSFHKTEYQQRLEIHYINRFASMETYTVYGIPSLLRSAFVNLLENACKFSGNQKVIVNVYKTSDNIEITIVDKGIGIPADELKNLFEPFYRASNALVFKGSGVGLSLVKKIIQLHGGNISIASEIDKGAKIEINVPLFNINN
jgi:signal transduction histidine kinase